MKFELRFEIKFCIKSKVRKERFRVGGHQLAPSDNQRQLEVWGGNVQQGTGRGCNIDDKERASKRQWQQRARQASEVASNWEEEGAGAEEAIRADPNSSADSIPGKYPYPGPLMVGYKPTDSRGYLPISSDCGKKTSTFFNGSIHFHSFLFFHQFGILHFAKPICFLKIHWFTIH
jgi:hypothetical protein